MIANRTVALIYRSIALILIAAGLVVHLGLFEGEFTPRILMYYTIQSNILTLVLFVLLWLRTFQAWRREGGDGFADYYPRFSFVVVIDILLTLLVYWILLAPQAFTMGEDYALYTFSNLSVHLFTPLFCLIDFILFVPSQRLKYRDVYAVLFFPLGYVLFTTIAGFMGFVFWADAGDGAPMHFPYFFLDFDRLGAGVFLYIIVLAVIFLAISHAFYLVDKKWQKPVLSGPKD